VNPCWSVCEENWGNGERHGWIDLRRLTVQGSPRVFARYLAALTRVLDAVEGLATCAVRAFGAWKRSVAAEPHLEHEDESTSTMRVRAREFRAAALSALVHGLGTTAPDALVRDGSRPLWEQHGTVAAEMWAEAGAVDLTEAPEVDVAVHLARMLPEEPEQGSCSRSRTSPCGRGRPWRRADGPLSSVFVGNSRDAAPKLGSVPPGRSRRVLNFYARSLVLSHTVTRVELLLSLGRESSVESHGGPDLGATRPDPPRSS
jgi:hypothetical protein